MTPTFQQIKPVILTILIAIGFSLHCTESRAAPLETAIVAGGCFWCVESDFEKVDGVVEVVSGFSGGSADTATYKQISRGGTGHLEAVKITYDPDVLSYATLINMFLRSVDVTDAGGQFCDRGEPYTTAIFATPAQKSIAAAEIATAERDLGQKIVTPVRPAKAFYPAEEYHQDYYKKSEIVLTRFGPRSKAKAYKLYRKGCGRDKRVKALWGKDAAFAGS